MTVDFEAVIRECAFAFVDKIKETNKAVKKTGGYPLDVGRNIAFASSLSILLNRLESSGANLEELGLDGINPLDLIEPAPRTPDVMPAKRSPYRKRTHY